MLHVAGFKEKPTGQPACSEGDASPIGPTYRFGHPVWGGVALGVPLNRPEKGHPQVALGGGPYGVDTIGRF